MSKFDSHAWMKAFKTYNLLSEKDKDKVTLKDLLHTIKVDGKKADKVDIKIGAENDLAIEKDKDGMDVYAGGLREAYKPGDMWSNDFDYVGMLKAGSQATYEDGLEYLQKLYDSFEDVNYHSENKHLGFASEEMENPGQDVNQAMANIEDYLEDFNKACLETLKDITKGKVQ